MVGAFQCSYAIGVKKSDSSNRSDSLAQAATRPCFACSSWRKFAVQRCLDTPLMLALGPLLMWINCANQVD
jgi:hypothetical protein